MLNKDYHQTFLKQIRVAPQSVSCIGTLVSPGELEKSVPAEQLKATNRVILTGCGDDYCAALAAKPLYEQIETPSGIRPANRTEAERGIVFSRYYDTYRKFWLDDQNAGPNRVNPLICCVSVSGSSSRAVEVMRRAGKYQSVPVAFTGDLQNDVAKSAPYAVNLNVTAQDQVPSVSTYVAALSALCRFGLHYCTIKGQLTPSAASQQWDAALHYAGSFTKEVMDRIEEQSLQMARHWVNSGMKQMELVADGPDHATALLGSIKMVESFGGLTDVTDSEEWCRRNYFGRFPQQTATFVIANLTSPSFARTCEMIRSAVATGRMVAVITDAPEVYFPRQALVIRMPAAKYRWCSPLLQHLPMDFAAAWITSLQNMPAYRTDNPRYGKDKNDIRLRMSQIVTL